MNFNGKVAIVTGGVQGLGKAISKAFLNAGMKLLVCDVNESTAKSFLEELSDNFKSNVIFQKCDVSSYEEFKAVFEKAKSAYGRIDIVINNAGISDESNWKRTIEVNFIGVIHGIYLGFEFMGINNGGSGGFIINTASSAGLTGFDMVPVYCGTKHGVVGLTRSFGEPYHFDKTGVTVNAVCPGAIDTQMYHTFPSSSLDVEKCTQFSTSLKAISPEEVAEAFMQLLRDGKNGALLTVSSGKGARYEPEKLPMF